MIDLFRPSGYDIEFESVVLAWGYFDGLFAL